MISHSKLIACSSLRIEVPICADPKPSSWSSPSKHLQIIRFRTLPSAVNLHVSRNHAARFASLASVSIAYIKTSVQEKIISRKNFLSIAMVYLKVTLLECVDLSQKWSSDNLTETTVRVNNDEPRNKLMWSQRPREQIMNQSRFRCGQHRAAFNLPYELPNYDQFVPSRCLGIRTLVLATLQFVLPSVCFHKDASTPRLAHTFATQTPSDSVGSLDRKVFVWLAFCQSFCQACNDRLAADSWPKLQVLRMDRWSLEWVSNVWKIAFWWWPTQSSTKITYPSR